MSKKNKRVLIIIGLSIFLLMFLFAFVKKSKEKKQEHLVEMEKIQTTDEEDEENGEVTLENGAMASDIIKYQDEYISQYGKSPDGFLWESDGTLISTGDKEMSVEDVAWTYMRSLSILDITTAQRYSKGSKVIEKYQGYFDTTYKNSDYYDNFLRDMYKQCLLSFQIDSIENVSLFADNRVVLTVKAKMLDLTNKSFWLDDSEEIYGELYTYDKESDSAKSDIFLYDYIINHYEKGGSLRDVSFDLTLQKFPEIDSGWLVTLDSDVDNACSYKEGKTVASYIKEEYRTVGKPLLDLQEQLKNAPQEEVGDENTESNEQQGDINPLTVPS